MRVLMLGWEFPPAINGGLGTACAGLVRALDRQGVDVTFVLPQPPPPRPFVAHAQPFVRQWSPPADTTGEDAGQDDLWIYDHITFQTIPVRLSPYETTTVVERNAHQSQQSGSATARHDPARFVDTSPVPPADEGPPPPPEIGLFADVKRYTEYVEQLAKDESFDVIHAHDWMTFPAALAVAGRSGKPLVVHLHSTESDRGGHNGDARISEIERRGVHGAIRVIAVSQFTKNLLVQQYGVPAEKVQVIYNAVEAPPDHRLTASDFSIKRQEKVVLFLGRLTMQKGPEYFLTAARKVLDVMDDVRFVMSGDGDLARHTVELAASYGIAHKVLFTGFLRGLDVERIYQIADLFVMPSVSEPFGIAPLEAIARQVPTIISKQSGVSEVLKHALKVDFWDTNELANKIVAVLRHPTLADMMRADGTRDVAKLSWAAAAKACVGLYRDAISVMPVRP
ncbi:MAG TPA: glycosyltransferase family 4 protein [Tepidisphaeraceae bacterium]